MSLMDKNIFDFTSLIQGAEKLYIKKVAIHYIGIGNVQIETSDAIYDLELTATKDSYSTIVDNKITDRSVYDTINTKIFAIPTGNSYIVRVSTESQELRLMDVAIIVSSRILDPGDAIESWIPGIPTITDPPVPPPGLDEDIETEDYDFDFGVVI